MSAYCFLDYTAGKGHLLLADLPELGWGIFEVGDGGAPENPVREGLAQLIVSAKRYPPALALAREDLGTVFGDDHPGELELAMAYETGIKTYLARQHESPHVMAKAINDDPGRLVCGEWYWVLEITQTLAAWVAADYRIRDNEMSDFDLTGEQLKRLGYAG